jgi:TPR repeat protein
MKQLSAIELRDRDAVRAYQRASTGGHAPGPDSPVAKAALRAIQRQELAHPEFDFVKAVLGDDQTEQRAQAAQVERGRQVARTATDHAPVPQNDAVDILRRSLAGVGVVDLAGAGASTIGSDVHDGEFLAKLKASERAREIMADPATPEAMKRATESAHKKGRKPTAEDFSEALTAVKAEQGPRPYTPPEPVVQLFAQSTSAAKATVSPSFSPVPDRFRR